MSRKPNHAVALRARNLLRESATFVRENTVSMRKNTDVPGRAIVAFALQNVMHTAAEDKLLDNVELLNALAQAHAEVFTAVVPEAARDEVLTAYETALRMQLDLPRASPAKASKDQP